MKKIEPPDTHYLSAASGWLGLGAWREAEQELAKISPGVRRHPDFLEVQYELRTQAKDWPAALDSAQAIAKTAPRRAFGWVHTAFALHELKRTREAYDALMGKLESFPKEWVIPYNLACYSCQLGQEAESIEWLKKAFQRGDAKELKSMALEDADLKPLRQRIKELVIVIQ